MNGCVDMNGILEKVAEDERAHREEANSHGRNRQQDQWQRHHPRRFMRLGIAVVRMVPRVVMRVGVFMVTLPAPEHQEIHAHAVEGGRDHAQQRRPECQRRHGLVAGMQCQNDAILGIETREQRHADQRQSARQRCPVRDGHVFAQPAHVAHVLVVVHGHDDGARCQEQQGLEERMGEQMEQRERIGRRPQTHDHVAQLRQRGIGHHALDVVLDQAHQAHQEGGRRSNRENDVQRHIAELKQRRHPRNHENARRDHGGRVDQR